MFVNGDVLVGFADYNALQLSFGSVRSVGSNAWVATGRNGAQLFVDIRTCGRNLRPIWEAAFGPLAKGYEVRPVLTPVDAGKVYLVVIAIIAILIGMLLPAVQKVVGTGGPIGQLNTMAIAANAVKWH